MAFTMACTTVFIDRFHGLRNFRRHFPFISIKQQQHPLIMCVCCVKKFVFETSKWMRTRAKIKTHSPPQTRTESKKIEIQCSKFPYSFRMRILPMSLNEFHAFFPADTLTCHRYMGMSGVRIALKTASSKSTQRHVFLLCLAEGSDRRNVTLHHFGRVISCQLAIIIITIKEIIF